jgi:WD40 repeat protein
MSFKAPMASSANGRTASLRLHRTVKAFDISEFMRPSRDFFAEHCYQRGGYQMRSYQVAKLAVTAWIFSLARRWVGRGVTANVLDPGMVKSEFGKQFEGPTGREVLTLTSHIAPVSDVAFSPDGSSIATASSDGTAHIWDGITGTTLLTLRGHTDQVRAVSYSPEGKVLATASFDETVKLWDATTGEELQTLVGHGPPLVVHTRSRRGQGCQFGSDLRLRILMGVLWNAAYVHPELCPFKCEKPPPTDRHRLGTGGRKAARLISI